MSCLLQIWCTNLKTHTKKWVKGEHKNAVYDCIETLEVWFFKQFMYSTKNLNDKFILTQDDLLSYSWFIYKWRNHDISYVNHLVWAVFQPTKIKWKYILDFRHHESKCSDNLPKILLPSPLSEPFLELIWVQPSQLILCPKIWQEYFY